MNLVNILFNVRDKKGGLVGNLNKDDFKVFEDGKEQQVKYFNRETDLPLTIGLLIDVSASQMNLIEIEKNAAYQFFGSVLRKQDLAFLISFGEESELLQDYTNSPKLLRAGLDGLHVSSGVGGFGPGPVPTISQPRGTVLYDAVYVASADQLKGQVGRKVLVLITDGEDEGSKYKISQAIEAAQKADAIIYGFYYVDRGFYMSRGMVFAGGSDSALAPDVGGHRRPRVPHRSQDDVAGGLRRAAGRNAQPIRHRLHAHQSGAKTALSARSRSRPATRTGRCKPAKATTPLRPEN